ncbi:hypothetical protein BZU93_29850 [Salmonella enterica subsp. enterica]|nr:hypothetical protein [Salmonella enterica subsp. enterica serovar Java]MIL10066.1 hypothetical protein [Salmonella enterica subsp. enterica serovar Enteritidis]
MTSSLPAPTPGLVIRYSYLWQAERLQGREEGRKDRPCAIVVSLLTGESAARVVVFPITHTAPKQPDHALEIPSSTKRRLGLDDERSWVILTEANIFSWPGPDLRPAVNGDLSTVAYGLLPDALFNQILDRFVRAVRTRRLGAVPRTE